MNDTCGHVRVINGKSWVCIRPVHTEDLPIPHPSETRAVVPNKDRHHFVKAEPRV